MPRKNIMRDQQYPENKVIDLTTSQVWNSDPLSTSVLTENARLIALAKVFGQAAESLIKAVRDWNNRKNRPVNFPSCLIICLRTSVSGATRFRPLSTAKLMSGP